MIDQSIHGVFARMNMRCAGFPPAAHLAHAGWAGAAITPSRKRRTAAADPSVERGSI